MCEDTHSFDTLPMVSVVKLSQNSEGYMTLLGKDPTPTVCLWGPVPCTPGLETNLNSIISTDALYIQEDYQVQAIREVFFSFRRQMVLTKLPL